MAASFYWYKRFVTPSAARNPFSRPESLPRKGFLTMELFGMTIYFICLEQILEWSLLRQAQPSHQVFVARVRAERVERGRTDDHQQFGVIVGIGFFEVFEGVVAVSARGVGERHCCRPNFSLMFHFAREVALGEKAGKSMKGRRLKARGLGLDFRDLP